MAAPDAEPWWRRVITYGGGGIYLLVADAVAARRSRREPPTVPGLPLAGSPSGPAVPGGAQPPSGSGGWSGTGPPAQALPHSREIVTRGQWLCEDGDAIEIPPLPLPAQLASAAGPVVGGIVAGWNAFRSGLAQIKSQRCTVGGDAARIVVLDVIQGDEATVSLDLEVAYDHDPPRWPSRTWSFSGTRSQTGEIPIVSIDDSGPTGPGKPAGGVDSAVNAAYLRSGGAQPGLPADWATPQPSEPAAGITRNGDDLTLWLYIPARGGIVRWRAHWFMS